MNQSLISQEDLPEMRNIVDAVQEYCAERKFAK